MNPLKSPVLRSIAVALALTALALVTALVLEPNLEASIFVLFILLPFLLAVWISSWYYGRLSGLTATIASVAAILFFFFRPEAGGGPAFSIVAPPFVFAMLGGSLTWIASSWRESRRRLTAALSSLGDGVITTDLKGRVTFVNSLAGSLLGWPPVEARGRASTEIVELLDEDSREPIENPLTRALRERMRVAADDHVLLVPRSGTELPIEYCSYPLRGDSGSVWGAILIFRDITKRRQITAQALHDQKLEAVSRMAGGVAGDFSNVLTVITGYANLLRAEVPPGSPLVRFVDEIVYGSERASALTRHLLAFARGSTAQPRVLDLNAVIAGMEPMLRRVLGHNIDLILLTSPGLGRVRADAAQVELVVVNLANNARDAMPDGGKLIIETANVDLAGSPDDHGTGIKPGSYVMLAVSDTGIGMDAEMRSRLFEPFFTTKPQGKGSGLGLATVYGTVKQSDGQLTCYSQPGCGTIFEIYLPRIKDKDVVVERVGPRSPRGSETILLVDDEEGVCKLLASILRSNGYDVLEASNGSAAMAVFEKNSHKIDLVVTDIVMPQMSGFELGHKLGERAPSLKILYMSGYRDNAFGSAGGEAPRAFLHKPFTPDILLAKVREVLDGPAPAPPHP
ncbi:MAG TPA: response regulator [Bryobacteraceae bacterium]|nr:response regulator [Bryobacteraceae bacterium]